MATLRRIKHYLALETFDCDEDTKLKLTEKLKIVVFNYSGYKFAKTLSILIIAAMVLSLKKIFKIPLTTYDKKETTGTDSYAQMAMIAMEAMPSANRAIICNFNLG